MQIFIVFFIGFITIFIILLFLPLFTIFTILLDVYLLDRLPKVVFIIPHIKRVFL